MKKTIALAALCCAAMGVNAENLEYDFNESPSFFPYLQAPVEDLGMGQAGNYDFIDKTGTAKVPGSDGELLQDKQNETWIATENRVRISLADGYAYYLKDNKWMSGDDELDYSEPFIAYGDKGPSRVTWMYGWGTTDAWDGSKDYNAATEADWISDKHAMGFLRNANSGSREDTYIQLPEVDGAATVTVWAGHAGGSYVTELRVKIVPVVDGVEQPAFSYYLPLEQTVAKRYYKLTLANLDRTTNEGGERNWADQYTGAGKVAYRIGCHKSEMHIYHVRVETGTGGGTVPDDSALESVIAPVEDANAPVYNILGQRVNENYKGIVIKNGVKYIQK